MDYARESSRHRVSARQSVRREAVNDLAQFLLERVAEDEAVARAVRGSGVYDERPAVKEWIGVANPQRMLVWSDARRRIIALHRMTTDGSADGRAPRTCGGCGQPDPCPTLRLMAMPWSDHPDYREEWRP